MPQGSAHEPKLIDFDTYDYKKFHGDSGPIKVQPYDYAPISKKFSESLASFGYPYNPEIFVNGGAPRVGVTLFVPPPTVFDPPATTLLSTPPRTSTL